MDIQKMMQQAQDVQFKLQELQEKMKDVNVEGESGGGLVKVTLSCAGIIKSLDIHPSILTADEKETTEDLIIAALNNAGDARDRKVQEETQTMMKSMGLPADAAGLMG